MNKIQDVSIPTKGTGKYLEVRALTFNLTPTNGISLYWAIHEETTTTDSEGVETKSSGAMLLEGNLPLPQKEYDQWGTDDNVIIAWSATELGLTLI